jgi:DNA-binding MarR family transcriptional regulator
MSTLHMADQTPQEPALIPTDSAERKRLRLTQTELGIVLALRAEGKTQAQIAQRLDKDQTTIGKALRRLGSDSTQLATHHLKARSYTVARRLARIAEKTDNEREAIAASKAVLAGAGVIQSGQQVTVNTAVLIAQPDRPETWGPGPAFLEAKVADDCTADGATERFTQ